MRTAINIPDDLAREADRLASVRGIARDDLYAAALERYLRDVDRSWMTEAVNRVCRDEDMRVPPEIEAAQSETLRDGGWK